MSGFQRAQRRRVFIKLAITGPSGSGKTYSALRLAFGLGSPVALLDTENGSGSLYANLGDYDVMELDAPFTVQKYVSGIQDAVAAGYQVLIIDSLSHAWAGDGGLLARKEALDARGGNPFSNWASISKEHEAFKSALLQSPIHIIGTMRSKTEYVMHEERSGKAVPRKVGLAPVQRDGIEYEFSTVFDVAMDHAAVTTKDRTGLFDGLAELLTERHGQRLRQWLEGADGPAARDVPSSGAGGVADHGGPGGDRMEATRPVEREELTAPQPVLRSATERRSEPPRDVSPSGDVTKWDDVAGRREPGAQPPSSRGPVLRSVTNGGPAPVWDGPGQCPGCQAPEGKRHATSCAQRALAA